MERNIRTVNGIVWEQSRPFLEKLASRELLAKPSNAQLLEILSYSLLPQCTSSLAVHGLGETVALTGEDRDMGVVDQAVNEGCGETVVTKDGIPLAELQVGGNDKALPFIAVGDHLKEQFGGILVEWNKTNFVNDQ